MRILITGGAGFIGSYLAEHHLAKNDRVYVVDNLSSGSINNVEPFLNNPNFYFLEEDIITWKDIEKTVSWADRVYHMAAIVGVYKVLEEPSRVLTVNIAGCERLLRAANQAHWKPRIILASSSEVYGPTEEKKLSENTNLIIESAARNRWHYAISKLAVESFGLAYYRKFGIPITMVRLFNTIGPRQKGRYGMVVPRFIDQAINNEPITIFGDGYQTRSFCDVRDVVEMMDLLASNPKSTAEIVNMGNDHEISINELAQLVKKLSDSQSDLKHISYEEAYGGSYVDIFHRRPDMEKLLSLIHYKHKWCLTDSIKDIIEYKRQNQS